MGNPERLRNFRAQQGLSQAALARRMKTAKSTLACWEIGARRPTLDAAARLEVITGGFVRAVDWAQAATTEPPQAA